MSNSTPKKPKKIQHLCKIQNIEVLSIDFLYLLKCFLKFSKFISVESEFDFRKAFYEIIFKW